MIFGFESEHLELYQPDKFCSNILLCDIYSTVKLMVECSPAANLVWVCTHYGAIKLQLPKPQLFRFKNYNS